jgi:hypothetical protein
MARFIGGQSRYLTLMAKISRIAGFIWLTLFTYASFVMFTNMNWRSLISEFTYLVVFGPILFLINNQLEKHYSILRTFKSGAVGETAIWKELHKLNNQYTVFEDLHLPEHEENIDFVVVGPTGVSFVEVKNHFGKVSYNGQQLIRNGKLFESDFLKTALNQTMDLHNYLISSYKIDAFINPVIVFAHPFARVHFGNNLISYVRVIQRGWLINTISTSTEYTAPVNEKLIECLEKLLKKS